MRKVQVTESRQLGIPTLLEDAERTNQARRFERSTAHLPGTMPEGIACYRALLERYDAALLAGDAQAAKRVQQEAVLLALKLNGGERGYLAGEDAPGCVLQRVTAAEAGRVPLWGQLGSFVIEACTIRVGIETRGLYGVCGPASFTAHAVDPDRPFLSESGYRSFIGYGPGPGTGLTVDAYARQIIERHVAGELRGRLLTLASTFRIRVSGDAP